MPTYVGDTETFPNFHCQNYEDIETGERFYFEISNRRNDLKRIVPFYLNPNSQFVGFNFVGYDNPLISTIIMSGRGLTNLEIKAVSDSIIASDNFVRDEGDNIIDLMKILHLDNKHRSASLKYIECGMRSPDVRDLPFPPDQFLTANQMDEVISYCWNDVSETKRLFQQTKAAIDFRIQLMQTIGLPSINYNDVKIGDYINKKTFIELTGKKIPNFGTPRDKIAVKDLIPSNIEFKSRDLQIFLTHLKDKTLVLEEKGALDQDKINLRIPKRQKAFVFHLVIQNKTFDFRVGGLHSVDGFCDLSSNDEYTLIDMDVTSMYPNTCIKYGYYPEHLGVEWLQGYEQTMKTRVKHKKLAKDKSLSSSEREQHQLFSDAYKLALNGAYGKTNSHYNWQFDPKVTYSVTFTGQLCLLMLVERFAIAGIRIVSANTDGVLSYVHKSQLKTFYAICKQWELDTMYDLEETRYERYFAKDVNNYLAKGDGWVKEKGSFEVDKKVGNQPAWYKDQSMRIVRIAVRDYLVEGKNIEDTIRNHTDIFDFCIAMRGKSEAEKGKASFVFRTPEGETKIGKIIRFYASNKGGQVEKRYENGSGEMKYIQSPHTLFMHYQDLPISEYDINYEFYIKESKKLVQPPAQQVQMSLF